jgi:hypothetical protein
MACMAKPRAFIAHGPKFSAALLSLFTPGGWKSQGFCEQGASSFSPDPCHGFFSMIFYKWNILKPKFEDVER